MTFGGSTACHVWLAAAFPAGDGAEVLDEVSSAVTSVVSVFTTKGSEVKLGAVIDDEEGGLGEVDLFQAVEKLLKEGGRAFGGDDDVAGNRAVGDEGIGLGAVDGFDEGGGIFGIRKQQRRRRQRRRRCRLRVW